jgi:conjugative transposon TraM protein
MEETENGSVKTRRFSQRQYQLVALVAFVLLGAGMVMWSLGVFKSDPKEQAQADPEENQTKALAVPEARNKAMDTDKYRNVDKDDARFRSDGNGDVNVGAVLGQERTDRQTTNELLDDNDYEAVQSAGRSQQLQSASQRKQQAYRNHQANQRQRAAENRRLSDPNAQLFTKSREEIAAERREVEDREMNQRTADLLLTRMENMNTQGGGAMPAAPATATNGAAGAPPAKPGLRNPNGQAGTVMHGEVSRNTIGQPNDKIGFFYNVSRQNTRRSYSGNDAIRAVVHGQGAEGITVQTGSTAKVRLEQNTVFNLGGQDVMLPKGTLLNGLCTIGDDRVYITVSSLVMGDAIYPIQVQAYDLDGLQGIHVPNLSEKNRVARQLTRAAASTANSGTGYVIGQGGVGQQVATQVATQASRGLMQGARQLMTNRAQQPRVTIRPNYRILLKSAELTPTSAPSVPIDDY